MKGAEKNGGYCNIHKGIHFNNSAERLLARLHASPFEEAAAISSPAGWPPTAGRKTQTLTHSRGGNEYYTSKLIQTHKDILCICRRLLYFGVEGLFNWMGGCFSIGRPTTTRRRQAVRCFVVTPTFNTTNTHLKQATVCVDDR